MKFDNAFIGISYFNKYVLVFCLIFAPSFACGQAETRGTETSVRTSTKMVSTRKVPPGKSGMFDRLMEWRWASDF